MDIKKIAINSILGVSIGFLTLIATSNKSLYEQIFASWFEQCRIALDTKFEFDKSTSDSKNASAYISVFSFGDVPEDLNVRFKSKVPMHRVQLLHSKRNNYLLHEDVAKYCPGQGQHCETNSQPSERYPQIDWKISNFSANLNPVFKADFTLNDKILDNSTFSTFIINSKELKSCRVELVSIWNFWAWGDKKFSILILLILLSLTTTLIVIMKKTLFEKSPESSQEQQ